jgi:crossover junction endonuclease EME1
MPVVIDLLSSPDLPPAKVTKKADVPALKLVPPSKALTYEAPKQKNDDFFTLSSDSIDVDSSLPPLRTAREPSLNVTSNPPQSKATNDFFFLSDDFDSTVVPDDDPFASDAPPAKKPRLSPPSGSRITRSPGYQKWLNTLEKGASAASPKNFAPSLTSNKTSVSDIGASSKSTAPKPNAESPKNAVLSACSYEASALSTAPSIPSNRRSVLDIGASRKPSAPRTSAGGMKGSNTMGAVVESDPIVFTSSPNPRADAKKRKDAEARKQKERINAILADSSDDDVFNLNTPKKDKGKAKSTRGGGLTLRHGNAQDDFEFESSDIDLPNLGAIPSQPESNKVSKGKEKATSKTSKVSGTGKSAAMAALERYDAEKAKEKKRKEKEQMAKDKLAAKEAEKEAKRLVKEENARKKDRAAELAKVNILRTDKKKSTSEMIVDLPSCLNTRLEEQIQTFLKSVEAEHSQYESTQPIIKWRRKIDAEFDEEAGHWEKVESYIGREKHIMCIVTANEFVELATGEEGKDLDSHVLRLKGKFATNEIIYLIEGLDPWMRKNKTVQNRKYVQQVRGQMPAEEQTASQKRRRKPEQEYVDEDLIEDALLKLQVMHGVLIHHTKVAIETAEWVIVFTQHISTIPYRYVSLGLHQNARLTFNFQSSTAIPRHSVLYGIWASKDWRRTC